MHELQNRIGVAVPGRWIQQLPYRVHAFHVVDDPLQVGHDNVHHSVTQGG